MFLDSTARNHSGFKCVSGTAPNFKDEGTQGWVFGSNEGRVGARRTRGLSGGVADIQTNDFHARIDSFLTECRQNLFVSEEAYPLKWLLEAAPTIRLARQDNQKHGFVGPDRVTSRTLGTQPIPLLHCF
jgi:hypothetical protein